MTARSADRTPALAALVLVTGVGPLATDTYVAALPQVERALHTAAEIAQLTMTAFLVGLALGQLLLAPVSDARGRRRMLIVSSMAFTVLSAICAAAPDAALLVAARALEGLAGGCGVAVGRAVVSDCYSGREAAARYGTLASITLLAPVIAPAIGGVLLLIGDWRVVFVFLTALGVAMTAATLVGIPETLPPERRTARGLRGTAGRMAGLLRRRAFLAAVAIQCLATAGFFTYIGGSSFVLQGDLGLSRGRYSLLFASNAAGMALLTWVFRALVRRVGPDLLRVVGLTVSTGAAVCLALYAGAATTTRLAPTWVLLAIVVGGMGLVIPATTAIAQNAGREIGGTASALQGGLTFIVGAAATPLTGVLGVTSVAGMGAIMAVLFLASAGVLAGAELARRLGRSDRPGIARA